MLWWKREGLLFVCRANVCRSPMAEAILRQRLREERLWRHYRVQSRAVENWCIGQAPHPKTRELLKHFHIPLRFHRSRQLKNKDGQRFSLIIGMDQGIVDKARTLLQGTPAKVVAFREFLPEDGDVLDPMQTGDFLTTYDHLYAGINNLIADLKRRDKHE